MGINMLPGVRATKSQRRVLTRYLENGGDKVDAYYEGLDRKPNPNKSKKHNESMAYNYFNTTTMRALMSEADIEVKKNMELKARAGLETAIDKYGITKDKILGELAKIAFAQQTDVASWGPDGVVIKDSGEIGDAASAVSEVTQTGGGEKSPLSVKVKMYDKHQALISLGKELGMFTEKHEVKGQVLVGAKFIIEGK